MPKILYRVGTKPGFMSLQLLNKLNGNKKGKFHDLIKRFNNKEPNIAWYPSSGMDFRALQYLHQTSGYEFNVYPDMFIYTDYLTDWKLKKIRSTFRNNPNDNAGGLSPWTKTLFGLNNLDFDDDIVWQNDDFNWHSCDSYERPTIKVIHFEELEKINLPIHCGVVNLAPSAYLNHVVFLKVKITLNFDKYFVVNLLYVFAENEAFCAEYLLKCNSKISQVLQIRSGGGSLGGGGLASGIWKLNVLDRLNCKEYITTKSKNDITWIDGDSQAVRKYPKLGPQCSKIDFINKDRDVNITIGGSIKSYQITGKIPNDKWSNYGSDVYVCKLRQS